MPRKLNSAAVGALARQARIGAGLTQTQLAHQIGASRFWVAAFEKGKPSAELGLALKAIHALGLSIHIGPKKEEKPDASHSNELARVIARATLTQTAPSAVVGWPTSSAPAASNRSRKR